MHVGYREAERSFPFRGPGPSSPRLHSTLPSLFPFLPSFPSARGLVELAQIPRGSRLENRCLSVSTPLPLSRPYAAGAQTAYVRSFSMRLRSLGTSASPSEEHKVFLLSFFFERDSQRLGGHHRRRSGGVARVSQTDALRRIFSHWSRRRTEKAFVCGAFFGGPRRMRAGHRAGGFRVTPSSCFVSEVSRTSRSTFLV